MDHVYITWLTTPPPSFLSSHNKTTQVAIAESVDSFLTVLHQFRDALLDIPLPPPSAVDLGQAIKDAQRETILCNGKAFKGDATGLEAEMLRLVEPLVVDVETAKMLCQDILRASSRTESGGDSYSISTSLLVKRGNLLTPAQVEVSQSVSQSAFLFSSLICLIWLICHDIIVLCFSPSCTVGADYHQHRNRWRGGDQSRKCLHVTSEYDAGTGWRWEWRVTSRKWHGDKTSS